MPSRPLRRIARRLLPTLAALALGGCASNEFTLEADLPGDFSLVGDARYSLPKATTATLPQATTSTGASSPRLDTANGPTGSATRCP